VTRLALLASHGKPTPYPPRIRPSSHLLAGRARGLHWRRAAGCAGPGPALPGHRDGGAVRGRGGWGLDVDHHEHPAQRRRHGGGRQPAAHRAATHGRQRPVQDRGHHPGLLVPLHARRPGGTRAEPHQDHLRALQGHRRPGHGGAGRAGGRHHVQLGLRHRQQGPCARPSCGHEQAPPVSRAAVPRLPRAEACRRAP